MNNWEKLTDGQRKRAAALIWEAVDERTGLGTSIDMSKMAKPSLDMLQGVAALAIAREDESDLVHTRNADRWIARVKLLEARLESISNIAGGLADRDERLGNGG